MKSGRELDALIAEKVMGWVRLFYKEANPNNPYFSERNALTEYWHDPVTLEQKELAEDSDDYYHPKDAWSPSENIADAWTVLETLFKTGFDSEIQLYMRNDVYVGPSYRIALREIDNQEKGWVEFSNSLPHAICLAALQVIDRKPEEPKGPLYDPMYA